MPLIVPALRALYVFLNVFDTFKTLKIPPPSARNGGQPSIRAMTQRKRAMKGCMTVWMVWCCFALYERTLDRLVGLFIPFYHELKALVILFFLLTRSRGAEPIYLHVLRPFIKPHVATLDTIMDFTQNVGDFLFVLSCIPMEFVGSLYRRWIRSYLEPPGETNHQAGGGDRAASSRSENPTLAAIAQAADSRNASEETVHGYIRTRRQALDVAYTRSGKTRAQPQATMHSNQNKSGPSTSRRNPPRGKPQHEIWHPPPSAYDTPPADALSGLPTPPAEQSILLAPEQPALDPADDWRQYEPFPAAYPATPLVTNSHLPRPSSLAMFGGISEKLPNGAPLYPDVSNTMAFTQGQGFQQSLEPPRESKSPGSDGHSSDDLNESRGAQHDDSEMDVDSDSAEGEDDDFDVTLRTPFPLKRDKFSTGTQSVASASTESLSNGSAGLSTTDHDSPLRSRANSEVSSLAMSDTSSLAGRKRPLPSSADDRTLRVRIKLSEESGTENTIRARPPAMRTRPALPRRETLTKESAASGAADGPVSDASTSTSAATKRRRVGASADGSKDPRRERVTRAKDGDGRAGTSTLLPRKTKDGAAETSLRPRVKVARTPTTGPPPPAQRREKIAGDHATKRPAKPPGTLSERKMRATTKS